jgi:hypothetical protein
MFCKTLGVLIEEIKKSNLSEDAQSLLIDKLEQEQFSQKLTMRFIQMKENPTQEKILAYLRILGRFRSGRSIHSFLRLLPDLKLTRATRARVADYILQNDLFPRMVRSRASLFLWALDNKQINQELMIRFGAFFSENGEYEPELIRDAIWVMKSLQRNVSPGKIYDYLNTRVFWRNTHHGGGQDQVNDQETQLGFIAEPRKFIEKIAGITHRTVLSEKLMSIRNVAFYYEGPQVQESPVSYQRYTYDSLLLAMPVDKSAEYNQEISDLQRLEYPGATTEVYRRVYDGIMENSIATEYVTDGSRVLAPMAEHIYTDIEALFLEEQKEITLEIARVISALEDDLGKGLIPQENIRQAAAYLKELHQRYDGYKPFKLGRRFIYDHFINSLATVFLRDMRKQLNGGSNPNYGRLIGVSATAREKNRNTIYWAGTLALPNTATRGLVNMFFGLGAVSLQAAKVKHALVSAVTQNVNVHKPFAGNFLLPMASIDKATIDDFGMGSYFDLLQKLNPAFYAADERYVRTEPFGKSYGIINIELLRYKYEMLKSPAGKNRIPIYDVLGLSDAAVLTGFMSYFQFQNPTNRNKDELLAEVRKGMGEMIGNMDHLLSEQKEILYKRMLQISDDDFLKYLRVGQAVKSFILDRSTEIIPYVNNYTHSRLKEFFALVM